MTGTSKAIGVDIGGTKTVVAAVDGTGRVLARCVFETKSERGFAAGLAELVESIQRVLRKANWAQETLSGIGIGCTGPVNPLRGTIHNPFTLPGWEDADIVTPLRQTFGVTVRLENDADAAAVGEYHFGAGRHCSPLVVVTLGTGVGGAFLVGGKIHRGVNGEHPELGHIPVLPGGPACYCGMQGCWESVASGTAIAAAGKEFGIRDSRAVFDAAAADPRAAAIVQRAVNATTTAAWTLFHTFLPQRILLGGGLGEAHFDCFAPEMRRQLSCATQFSNQSVEILKAQLGNGAGVIGAACLAFRPENSPSKL